MMEDGFYAVKNGEVFKIDPRIKMPIAKSVNVKTGEIHYPSNADRIRSMSDAELAEEFAGLTECVCCPCRASNDACDTVDGSCQKQWLDWLKKVAEEGE